MKINYLHARVIGVFIALVCFTLGSKAQNFEVESGLSHFKQSYEAIRLSGANAYLSFRNGSTLEGRLQHSGSSLYLYNNISGGHTYFGTQGNAKMTIRNTGFVGIGTTVPATKLEVSGYKIRLSTPGNAARLIELRTDGAGMDVTALGGGLFLNAPGNDVYINGNSKLRPVHGAIVTNGNSTENALEGKCTYTGVNIDRYGVYGENIVSPNWGYGVFGRGGYRGVYGVSNLAGGGVRTGVYGTAGNSTGTNYGVYGSSTGTAGTRYAGYFAGNLHYTGALTGPSDVMFKTDIAVADDMLDKINTITVKNYKHKSEYVAKMNFSDKPQTGIIAQELQTVFPDLVSKNIHENPEQKGEYTEYLGVNYIGLIPILTKGIQELSAENEDLKSRLARLEAIVDNLDK